MIKKISEKDKKDWLNFLKSDEKLKNKDLNTNKNTSPNIKTIDLHGFTLEEANKKIEKIINDAYEKDVSKVIVVTGKGIHSNVEKDPYVSKDLSILKFSVPDYIENNSELMKKIIEIKDADKEDGGSGAFYIYLKRKNGMASCGHALAGTMPTYLPSLIFEKNKPAETRVLRGCPPPPGVVGDGGGRGARAAPVAHPSSHGKII